jgi:hypothetical protein
VNDQGHLTALFAPYHSFLAGITLYDFNNAYN